MAVVIQCRPISSKTRRKFTELTCTRAGGLNAEIESGNWQTFKYAQKLHINIEVVRLKALSKADWYDLKEDQK